jgi:hypothetical protein
MQTITRILGPETTEAAPSMGRPRILANQQDHSTAVYVPRSPATGKAVLAVSQQDGEHEAQFTTDCR